MKNPCTKGGRNPVWTANPPGKLLTRAREVARTSLDNRGKKGHSPRVLRLHASFFPPGTKGIARWKGYTTFLKLYGEARALRIQKAEEALRVREQNSKKIVTILEKMDAVFQSYNESETDKDAISQKLREICPDAETQMEVVKFLFKVLDERRTMTEEDIAGKEAVLAAQERKIAESQRLIDALGQVRHSLELLSNRLVAGDEQAIAAVLSIAEEAFTLLLLAEKIHPATVSNLAAGRMHWPILGSREPGWERMAAKKMESLKLGSGLEFLHTRFREARGADENYPARQWAKEAVRTLEETRWRTLIYADYQKEFQELILDRGVDACNEPKWVEGALQLDPFSTATLRAWGMVIRDMIREQLPEFHTAPVWASHCNTARHNCRNTRGEIQNAILDDIVSALRPLAPSPKMPKPGS